VIGVLYLEETTGIAVFTPARIAVRNAGVAKRRISLEERRMYQTILQEGRPVAAGRNSNLIGVRSGFSGQGSFEAHQAFLEM